MIAPPGKSSRLQSEGWTHMAAAVIHFLQLEGEVTNYQFYSFGIWENFVDAVGWLLVIGWFVVGIFTFPGFFVHVWL